MNKTGNKYPLQRALDFDVNKYLTQKVTTKAPMKWPLPQTDCRKHGICRQKIATQGQLHPTQTKFVKRFISEVIRNKRKITFSICVGPPRELSTSLFQMRFDY